MRAKAHEYSRAKAHEYSSAARLHTDHREVVASMSLYETKMQLPMYGET